ncbi:MAG TPA: hypothetical protein ENJ97_05630 [Planctomycetes bacterium]|nr:hypothetical protein [Planctomycetota bacterium]
MFACFLPLAPAWGEPPYREREVKGLSRFHGSRKALAFLLQKGFVVPGWTRDSMVQFYQVPVSPRFITTDAGWDFFQRMVERAFKAGEKRKALDFSFSLGKILDKILERPFPFARKTALYSGVPFLLSGGGLKGEVSSYLGKKGVQTLRKTVQALRSAESGRRGLKVSFLEKDLPPVFRPEGFYAESEPLKGYWRAIQ